MMEAVLLLSFQSYTRDGHIVGHQISRKPPLGNVSNKNASFVWFLKLFSQTISHGMIPTKL